ncbi:MAG: ribonuclease HII, partial [Flavobacteriales bacterium]|nr:ribonuclease HII [Flavobacteriales bacterium]
FKNKILNDSKQLSESKRDILRPIIEKVAIAWGVGVVWNERIDEINILNASYEAMHLAVDQLTSSPEALLIDGNRFKPKHDIPYHCIVKGDGKYMSIAAASVLAKTHRDSIMSELHEQYDMYQWSKNKGYPTKAHREAIRHHGTTSFHRASFKLLPDQLEIKCS